MKKGPISSKTRRRGSAEFKTNLLGWKNKGACSRWRFNDYEFNQWFNDYHIKGKFNRLLEKFNEKGNNCFNPFKKKLSERLQFQ